MDSESSLELDFPLSFVCSISVNQLKYLHRNNLIDD